jgi:hypothetical protein
MGRLLILVIIVFLAGCNVISIKNDDENLPHIELTEDAYFCRNGEIKIKVDLEELIITCRIKI